MHKPRRPGDDPPVDGRPPADGFVERGTQHRGVVGEVQGPERQRDGVDVCHDLHVHGGGQCGVASQVHSGCRRNGQHTAAVTAHRSQVSTQRFRQLQYNCRGRAVVGDLRGMQRQGGTRADVLHHKRVGTQRHVGRRQRLRAPYRDGRNVVVEVHGGRCPRGGIGVGRCQHGRDDRCHSVSRQILKAALLHSQQGCGGGLQSAPRGLAVRRDAKLGVRVQGVAVRARHSRCGRSGDAVRAGGVRRCANTAAVAVGVAAGAGAVVDGEDSRDAEPPVGVGGEPDAATDGRHHWLQKERQLRAQGFWKVQPDGGAVHNFNGSRRQGHRRKHAVAGRHGQRTGVHGRRRHSFGRNNVHDWVGAVQPQRHGAHDSRSGGVGSYVCGLNRCKRRRVARHVQHGTVRKLQRRRQRCACRVLLLGRLQQQHPRGFRHVHIHDSALHSDPRRVCQGHQVASGRLKRPQRLVHGARWLGQEHRDAGLLVPHVNRRVDDDGCRHVVGFRHAHYRRGGGASASQVARGARRDVQVHGVAVAARHAADEQRRPQGGFIQQQGGTGRPPSGRHDVGPRRQRNAVRGRVVVGGVQQNQLVHIQRLRQHCFRKLQRQDARPVRQIGRQQRRGRGVEHHMLDWRLQHGVGLHAGHVGNGVRRHNQQQGLHVLRCNVRAGRAGKEAGRRPQAAVTAVTAHRDAGAKRSTTDGQDALGTRRRGGVHRPHTLQHAEDRRAGGFVQEHRDRRPCGSGGFSVHRPRQPRKRDSVAV